jgi:NADH-quinone oxidoreductase subunit N
MVSLQRQSPRSAEGGLKYFLLGGAASAVLLYGVTLLYGTTGTLLFGALVENSQSLWQGQFPILFVLGLVLVAVGLLFKVGAVPFHSWVPDVYTGAVTPVTGFMISAVKLAAVGLLVRLGAEIFALPGLFSEGGALSLILNIVTILTLLLGSLIGLAQTNLKRLLAYSTIAHTGYLLLGFAALTVGKHPEAADALASYAVIYAIMNIGCFAVLTLLTAEGKDDLEIKDLAGLGKRRPVLAFALSVFLLSMAGIPPTAGFFGKYYLFMSAIAADQIALTVLAALASLVSAAYYLRPLVTMYMDESSSVSEDLPQARWLGASLVTGLSLIVTILFGLLPGFVSGLL